MMLTQEQDYIIQQALMRGLAKNRKEAYEAGCQALRRQLQELRDEENAKQKAAVRAEADAIARNPFNLLRESSPSFSPTSGHR
jgi:hypothetical protein